MIELPEAKVLGRQLGDTIVGKKIVRVEAGVSAHRFAFFFGSPEYYPHLLCERAIEKAEGIGGQVELFLGDMRLSFNDGVNIRYLGPGEKRPAKHQLLLELEDNSAIVCTVQMYGGLHAFIDGENDNFYYLVHRQKPSPLSGEFTEDYFEGLRKGLKSSVSAKAFLATEQRIPGLGNGVLQDILFHAGIHPKSKITALLDGEWESMYKSVRDILAQMIKKGGRNTEKDLFGREGGYPCALSKNTLAEPCPVCGGAIIREAYLGGNIYYCPMCQPLKK